MTWKSFHHRGEILRDVIATADVRRDGVLPMDVDGVAETFGDELDLLGALQLRWHTRLAGRIERELMSQPMDLERRGRRRLARHRRRAARRPRHPRPATAPSRSTRRWPTRMAKSAAKEQILLAVMAGRASAPRRRCRRRVGAADRGRRGPRPTPRLARAASTAAPSSTAPGADAPSLAVLPTAPPAASARGCPTSAASGRHDGAMTEARRRDAAGGHARAARPQLRRHRRAAARRRRRRRAGRRAQPPLGGAGRRGARDWGEIVAEPEVLFRGGPVSTEGALAVALLRDADDVPVGFREVVRPARRWSTSTRPSSWSTGPLAGMRIFAGYAGWGAEQLAGEIDEGSWYVVPGRGRRRLPARPRRPVARRAAPPARRARVALDPPARSGPELSVRLAPTDGADEHHRLRRPRHRRPIEDRRTVPTDEGDHERFSHYVDKDKLTEAMVMGTPVVALCGKVWVPSRAPGEVPGLPGVQGNLGGARSPATTARDSARSDGTATTPPAPTGLTPAWPERAAWGTAHVAARLADGGDRRSTSTRAPRDFLAVATPGRRQDDVRAVGRRRAARPPDRRPDHRRRADRAPQAPVGRGGRPGRHPDRPGVLRRQGQDLAGLRRHRGHLRRRRGQPARAADPHRAVQDAGDPRRGAPRRRRAVVGRGRARGVRAGAPGGWR